MLEMPQNTPELLVTNFHRRFTGVSATADAVVSKQKSQFRLCLVGHPLPSGPEPISYRRAIRLCRRQPADRPFVIWHVRRNLEMASAIFARDVLRLPIRVVFTSAAQRLHSPIPQRLIEKMDAVIATTEKAATFVPNVIGVVPHGVDTERFTPAPDRDAAWASLGYGGRYGIGTVGRIRPEKGTDLFVEAMLRVLPQRPDFTAVIIGRAMPRDAPFERQLRDRVAAAGLGRRVLFLGEQPPEKIPGLVRSLSLLVAPARYEGYGMTVLEAMSSGVAVVASDTGVYGEIIQPGFAGQVVPLGDVNSLVSAVMGATGSQDRFERMGEFARRFAESKISLRHEVDGYSRLLYRIWRGERVCPLRDCA